MNHTPGPWRIGDAGHTVFGAPNGTPSPETIAACSFKNQRAKANARLIAAAPDLLAALQEIMAELDNREPPQGSIYRDTGGMLLARQAIAKATQIQS